MRVFTLFRSLTLMHMKEYEQEEEVRKMNVVESKRAHKMRKRIANVPHQKCMLTTYERQKKCLSGQQNRMS